MMITTKSNIQQARALLSHVVAKYWTGNSSGEAGRNTIKILSALVKRLCMLGYSFWREQMIR